MDARTVAKQYFACLNGEQWDEMRQLWHDDARLRAVGARPREGGDAVVDYFRHLFAPWRAHHDEPTRLVQAIDDTVHVVTAEVTFTGTTPSGSEVTFEAVDVFDIVDGRIRRFSNWYDLEYARRALAGGTQ